MDMTLEHAAIDHDDPPEGGPRLCACGCGTPLRDGAKRSYIRGHKSRNDNTEPDPEPGAESKQRVYRATAKIKAEMRDSVEAYLAMAAGAWAMTDPYCGAVALECVSNIADKLMPILSRNQAFLRYFNSSNSFREGMDLFMAMLPLLQVAAKHHLFRSVGHENREQEPDYNAYVA